MRRTVRVRHGSAHGVSTPSAASWLDRASGPCRVALAALRGIAPSGLSSLQSLPFAWVARPSSRPLAPLPFVLVVLPVRRARSCHPRFHRLGRRSGVVPRRILRELGAPFQRTPRGGSASRSPWTSHAGLTVSRPFRRLRSVLPHRESVHVASAVSLAVHLDAAAGALLGVLAPPEPCSRQDLEPSLTRPPRRRPSSRGVPFLVQASRPAPAARRSGPRARTSRGLRHERGRGRPSTPGGIERGRPKRPARPVGGHRTSTVRAVPPRLCGTRQQL